MNKKILILAAHPDDEVIGCGGTIAKMASQGHTIEVITFTDGISARKSGDRTNQVMAALEKLISKQDVDFYVNTYDFPDNEMDSVPLLDIVKKIEKINFIPDIVLTHSPYDLNVDHRIVHQATMTAFRGIQKFNKTKIMCYEVISSSEWGIQPFNPNCYVNIEQYWIYKERALNVYIDEMRAHPFPRNVANLKRKAYIRGSECGVELAEAFMIMREIL